MKRICENPWNLWENILKQKEYVINLPQMSQIYTDIGCGIILPQMARIYTDIGCVIILPRMSQIFTDVGCGLILPQMSQNNQINP